MSTAVEQFPVSFDNVRELLVKSGPSALAGLAGKNVDLIEEDDSDPHLGFGLREIGTNRVLRIGFHVGEFLHLSGLVKSRAEAKRLVAQGAVEVDGARVKAFTEARPIRSGSILKIGKRRWVRIVNADTQQ